MAIAIIFFSVALVAALFGFTALGETNTEIWQGFSCILLVLSLLFFGIGLLAKRGPGTHPGS